MKDFINVTDYSFTEEIIKNKSLTLVEFVVNWCGPCQKQLSILELISNNIINNIKIATIDIEDAPLTFKKYKVKSVPTLLLFKGGEKLTSKVGIMSVNDLNSLINTYISECEN